MPPTAEPTLAPPEVPRPVRSRMVWWLVVLPAALLLLALGAANWRVFHRAYYKHCAREDRFDTIAFDELVRVHLRKGMSMQEARQLFESFDYTERGDEAFVVCTYGFVARLKFRDGHLIEWETD